MRSFPRGHEKYLFHQSAKKRLSTTEDQFKGEKSSKLQRSQCQKECFAISRREGGNVYHEIYICSYNLLSA